MPEIKKNYFYTMFEIFVFNVFYRFVYIYKIYITGLIENVWIIYEIYKFKYRVINIIVINQT